LRRLADVQETVEGLHEVVAVPPGVHLRSDEERTVWAQYAAARAAKDWRPMDLLLLGKIVRIEVDMRRHQAQLEQEGPVIETARGTPVENPLNRIIDTLLRQQLAIIRSMSLNAMPSAPSVLANAARSEADARQVFSDRGGVAGLLAMPGPGGEEEPDVG
jgi:hypothetical protein